jgi:putative ABC transport system permease protein
MYVLLTIPFGIILWARLPMFGQAIISVVRMSVQLLFVGVYLQVVFRLNNPWLNILWLLVMIAVADGSVLKGCGLKWGKLAVPLFLALTAGTAIPLLYFMAFILQRPDLLAAQYVIPIGGMILGNCLRADIIGLRTFCPKYPQRTRRKGLPPRLAEGAGAAPKPPAPI